MPFPISQHELPPPMPMLIDEDLALTAEIDLVVADNIVLVLNMDLLIISNQSVVTEDNKFLGKLCPWSLLIWNKSQAEKQSNSTKMLKWKGKKKKERKKKVRHEMVCAHLSKLI